MKFKKGDIVTLVDGYSGRSGRLDDCYPPNNLPCPTPYTGFIIDYNDEAFGPNTIDYKICCLGGCNHKKWVYSCFIKDHEAYADFLEKIKDRMK